MCSSDLRYISQPGKNDRVRPREIETVHKDVVDACEWDALDSTMPDDFRYEIHDRSDDVGVGRHHEHPGDTFSVEPVPFRPHFLGEEGNNPRRLDRRWKIGLCPSCPRLRRLRSKGSLEPLPVRDGQANHETNYEGEWRLEWAIEGEYGHRHDEQVEEEPKTREPNHDRRNRMVDLPEVPGERKSQKGQCALKDYRQGLHDEMELPSLDPIQLPLPHPVPVRSRPMGFALSVSIEPLLSEHGEECR